MRPSAGNPGTRRRSRGQSLAEFAIVFPVFMLILGGIIQFGIIFWGLNTLNQVVRDTGRWAATQTNCSDVPGVTTTANDIAAQSSLIGFDGSLDSVIVTWAGDCPPTNNQDVGWVRITATHTVPVFFLWVPGDGQISSSTEFRMEPEPE